MHADRKSFNNLTKQRSNKELCMWCNFNFKVQIWQHVPEENDINEMGIN